MGDASGRSVDWHTNDRVRVHPLRDVEDPEEKAAIEAELTRLRGDLAALADTLSRGRLEERALGIELRNALHVPSPDNVYVREARVGDTVVKQPLLIAWGYRSEDDPGYGEAPRALGQAAKAAAAATEPPVPPPIARTVAEAASEAEPVRAAPIVREPFRLPFPWWWLLLPLLALLLLGIGWTLNRACGIGLPGGLGPVLHFCPELRAADIGAGIPDLRATVDELEAKAKARREDCRREAAARQTAPTQQATDDSIRRRLDEANAQAGDLQVSLTWENKVDLDLFVRCPNGALVGFANRIACGGQLDIDRNANSGELTDRPVENIVWSDRGAISPGRYEVFVLYCKSHGNTDPTVPFTLRIINHGQTRIESGVASRSRDTRSGLCPTGCDGCLVPVTTIQR